MKADSLMWADNMIRHHYRDWLGIDDRIEMSIRQHLICDGNALDVECGKRGPLGSYRENLKLLFELFSGDVSSAETQRRVHLGDVQS